MHPWRENPLGNIAGKLMVSALRALYSCYLSLNVCPPSAAPLLAPHGPIPYRTYDQGFQCLVDPGRPGACRCTEPGPFETTNLQSQIIMVHSLAIVALSPSVFLPSFLPMVAKAWRSPSVSRIRPWI